jgi:hypothetical protein
LNIRGAFMLVANWRLRGKLANRRQRTANSKRNNAALAKGDVNCLLFAVCPSERKHLTMPLLYFIMRGNTGKEVIQNI